MAWVHTAIHRRATRRSDALQYGTIALEGSAQRLYLCTRKRGSTERLERINAGKRDYLLEYAQAFDANDDAAQAAILKIAEENHGLDLAIGALHAKFDGERTMCEHLRAMRENANA